MPHLWPALRGVLWEYWAALLVGGFWGQCSHGMPHVIRIGKAAGPRGARSGRGAGAGDALPGDGKDGTRGRGAGPGAVRSCVPRRSGAASRGGAGSRHGAVPCPGAERCRAAATGVARPVRAAALGTVQ